MLLGALPFPLEHLRFGTDLQRECCQPDTSVFYTDHLAPTGFSLFFPLFLFLFFFFLFNIVAELRFSQSRLLFRVEKATLTLGWGVCIDTDVYVMHQFVHANTILPLHR